MRSVLRTHAALSHASVAARSAAAQGPGRHVNRFDLSGIASAVPSGTIDPVWGCDLIDSAGSYALSNSLPWRKHSHIGRGRGH